MSTPDKSDSFEEYKPTPTEVFKEEQRVLEKLFGDEESEVFEATPSKVFKEEQKYLEKLFASDDETKTKEQSEVPPRQQQVDKGSPKFIGEYEVTGELGQGGMGKVYKVFDKKLNRELAIKTLLRSNDEQQRKRLLQEAKSVSLLDHLNITKVYRYFLIDDIPYIVMQYIEGKSLKQYIKENSLTLEKCCEIICKVADALSYAHQKGILHRDIKPSNIMIDKEDNVYLMDFGLAKMLDQDRQITKTGSVLGTPRYMSPEQAKGKYLKVDQRSDIYSLGAVLYEILTGKPVIDTDHIANIFYQIAYVIPKSPRQINPKISPAMEAICLKMLEKKQSNRYQKVDDVVTDIETCLQGKTLQIKMLPKNHSKMVAAIMAALSLIALLFLYLPESPRSLSKEQQKQLQQSLFQESQLLISNKKYAQAEKPLKRLTELFPDDLSTRSLLIKSYERQKKMGSSDIFIISFD